MKVVNWLSAAATLVLAGLVPATGPALAQEPGATAATPAADATDRDLSILDRLAGDNPEKASEDQGYLYLKGPIETPDNRLLDTINSQPGNVSSSSARPGLGTESLGLARQRSSVDAEAPSSLLGVDTLQIGYFTPRYAGFLVGIDADEIARGDDGRGFGVSISSTYLNGGLGLAGTGIVDLSDMSRSNRAYNVGLNVGFAGFKLGASYLRGDRESEFGMRGYDFGLMYEGRAWASSRGYAATSQRGKDLFFGDSNADTLQSVEVEASYTFRFGLTLAGGIQYYDYGLGFLNDEADDAQIFYLGTHLSF